MEAGSGKDEDGNLEDRGIHQQKNRQGYVVKGNLLKYPKHSYVRSKKLLENARKIPCTHCGTDDGTVVAAHTNWGGGKGRGIKADDNLIASLCFRCHSQLDQGSNLTKSERMAIWFNAHFLTVKILQVEGLWPDDVPLPKGLS